MPTRPRSLEARLVEILESFERDVEGVRGSAVADREGLPIANGFREAFDLAAVTAMSTLAVESSQNVFREIGLGTMRTIVLEGDDSKVVIYTLGGGRASFISLVRSDANVGLLKLRMALAAKALEEELGFAPRPVPRVEELFLLTRSGLVIAHRSRSPGLPKDPDILAGMLTAVSAFVKDAFGGAGGSLEEMEMAQLRVRIIRGRWSAWVVIASGPVRGEYVAEAERALSAFEEANAPILDRWNGDPETLRGVDDLIEDLFARSIGWARRTA